VKPLIWVEAVVEPHSHSRIEYMIKAKSQFKARSVANNVEIIIPVPRDVDSPSFKVLYLYYYMYYQSIYYMMEELTD
jgi:AP-1 complex subunit mu